MDRRWLPLNALRAFEAAGRAGSFTGASHILRVTQSAVSRHVIGLEDFLGRQLFERKRHSLVLTEAGARLLPVVSKSLDRLDFVLESIIEAPGPYRPSLAVTLPPSFAGQLAVPLLSDFREAFPEINLEIRTLPSQSREEEGRNSVSVIYSEPQVSEEVLDLLWQIDVTPVCHPKLIEGGILPLAAFLEQHDLIHVANAGRPPSARWEAFLRFAGLQNLDAKRGVVFDTAQLALEYAMSGNGIALLDPVLFARDLAAGRLVRPYDLSIHDGFGYYLSVNPEELENPVVAAFRSWLVRRFAGPRGAATTLSSGSAA